MMKDQRRKVRATCREEALVRLHDAFAMRRCTVENRSPDGVCIRMTGPQFLPEDFLLLPEGQRGPLRACRVKWRRGARIGAEFVVR